VTEASGAPYDGVPQPPPRSSAAGSRRNFRGLRVYIPQSRSAAEHGSLLRLDIRDPQRRPSRELERLLPTPLEPDGREDPIVIDPMPPESQYRALWTLGQIVRFLFRRFRLRLTGRLDDETHATLTRQLFEQLSGMWIKVGQLLSLRSDVMSEIMVRELSNLQYQMRGFPIDVARRVIEEDLQQPLSKVFAHFEEAPFAAASIAQVHRATLLRNNRAVVVKVMRPDVARTFQRDLRFLNGIVRVLNLLHLFGRFRLNDAMRELRAVLMEEVDYQHEAVNLRRMRKNLRDHGIYVPRLIRKLTRQRVLVLEDVQGLLMSRYIQVRREDPERLHRWAVLNGVESKTVAKRLSISVLRQILEDNEFHGDLHPGNIVLLADNRIALIDFGSVGRLRQHTWNLYRHSLAAIASGDYDRAADYMLMMAAPSGGGDNRRVRREMTAALQAWEFNTQRAMTTYSDRSLDAMTRGVAKVMADNKMPLSWGIMRVGRTFSTLDASLRTLAPETDFLKMCRAYFRDRRRRQSSWRGRQEAWQRLMRQGSAVAGDVQVLLSSGLRAQALRLHGMLDRAGRVKLVALTLLSRGLWMFLGLTSLGFIAVEDIPFTSPGTRLHEALDFIVSAVPNLHPLHWITLLIMWLFLARLAHNTRNALARSESE
jgi:ubiquinone biosynthesis protein